jgi:hypothetical protein
MIDGRGQVAKIGPGRLGGGAMWLVCSPALMGELHRNEMGCHGLPWCWSDCACNGMLCWDSWFLVVP